MARLREFRQGLHHGRERLKERDGGNYFDELLEGIRDIRCSERVFWRKMLDIYSLNQMHWEADGQTAAEV